MYSTTCSKCGGTYTLGFGSDHRKMCPGASTLVNNCSSYTFIDKKRTKIICDQCEGRGMRPEYSKYGPCKYCHGKGWYKVGEFGKKKNE